MDVGKERAKTVRRRPLAFECRQAHDAIVINQLSQLIVGHRRRARKAVPYLTRPAIANQSSQRDMQRLFAACWVPFEQPLGRIRRFRGGKLVLEPVFSLTGPSLSIEGNRGEHSRWDDDLRAQTPHAGAKLRRRTERPERGQVFFAPWNQGRAVLRVNLTARQRGFHLLAARNKHRRASPGVLAPDASAVAACELAIALLPQDDVLPSVVRGLARRRIQQRAPAGSIKPAELPEASVKSLR